MNSQVGERPLVTVVIPVFNRAGLLKRCVESVLEQSLSNVEVIISDNASTDNTREVAQHYARTDSRVKVIGNEFNVGPVENWIRGIAAANGEYCKLLFSDDYLKPECLSRCVEEFKSDDVAFVFSSVAIEGMGDTGLFGKEVYSWVGGGRIRTECFVEDLLLGRDVPVSPSAGLFRTADLRKNILRAVPNSKFTDWMDHGAGVDLLAWLLTAVNYESVVHVNEVLMVFGNPPNTLTRSLAGYRAVSRYLQARVWFAANHCSSEMLSRLLAQAWVVECHYSKTLITRTAVAEKYLGERRSIPIETLVAAGIQWASHGLSRRLSRARDRR